MSSEPSEPSATLRVAAVVVTYNRSALLQQAIAALLAQTCQLARIVIVDNASTDDTTAVMHALGWTNHPLITCLSNAENLGGAGGFCTGIAHCLKEDLDWIWLTDDDAIAEPAALAALLAVAPDPSNVYGSAAVCTGNDGRSELCWPVTINAPTGEQVSRDPAALPALTPTASLPFLGFLIAPTLVQRIGLPDAAFFISGDDIEYVLRARRYGAASYLVRDSRLHHPRPSDYHFSVAGRRVFCLRLAPWRRYFYVRNKVVIARRHLGLALYTATLPGLLLRLLATLLHEPDRRRQLRAYLTGLWDGWLGHLGNPPARRQL